MQAILDQDMMTLSAAAKIIPGRPHTSTVFRWAKIGARGVRLETVLIGGVRYVSRHAIEEFVAKINAASPVSARPGRATSTPRQRQRAIERAEKELDGLGV